MSSSQQKPWSENTNAPQISYHVYSFEKASFAGLLIASILYGILIILFFKCMTTLLNPAHHRGEHIKWGIVSYTVAMFSLATVQTAMLFHIESISYIDNREFSGLGAVIPPGPYGYQLFISPEAINIIPSVALTLNNWLADGLLLYRCYIIYSRNLWVIAFPCLIYLGYVAMGIVVVYQTAQLSGNIWAVLPYFSISLSFNVLLTLMIVIRLIFHAKTVRNAMGMAGVGGLCKAIITMLVESCALYAVNSVLFIGLWSARNSAENIFLPILTETQTIAPLLIIQQVADKSALTSNTVASGRISSIKAGGRGKLTGSDTLPGGVPTSSVDGRGMSSGELKVGVETTSDFH